MSISLNNHEQRITALENKIDTPVIKKIKWENISTEGYEEVHGSLRRNLRKSIDEFDIIAIRMMYSGKIWTDILWVGTELIESTNYFVFDSNIGFAIQSLNNRMVLVVTDAGDTSKNRKWYDTLGLKLYYNFSYNIYNVKVVRIVKKLINFFKYHLLSSNFYF